MFRLWVWIMHSVVIIVCNIAVIILSIVDVLSLYRSRLRWT